MSNRQLPSNDEMEIAEAKNPLIDLLYDYTAQAMTTRVGNYVYHRFDTCLSVVEKTAKWSLPQSPPPSEEDTSKVNISPPPLIRPLPWIMFLPALIALRLIRASLSLVALMIGKQPVYPENMVAFLQSRRRKLRALKYRGQKIQRMRRAEKESEGKPEALVAKSWLEKITLPLRYMICLRAVRPGSSIHQKEHHHHHHHRQGQSRDSNNEAANKDGAKPRDESARRRKRNAHERDADDSESSVDATVQELLEKYADEEGDSSFHASDSITSESDSYVTESDKSLTETTDVTEEKDSKKAKKETNGHVTPPEKEPADSQKSEEPKKRSSLNAVDSNETSEKKAKPPVAAESATGNGKVSPKNEPKESQPETYQSSMRSTSDTIENLDSKLANLLGSAKAHPSEDITKDASKNPLFGSMKTNYQQKNMQQQPQQQSQQQQQPNQKSQQQNPPQQQQQHQQTTTVNGGGGGGRKHKKHYHHQAQQHH
ncbi:AAEL006890-PA [Aedes aegypti]|nr:RNA polymerase II degradation factor 1 isoform X2 [Aedes aegypti]XP_021695990.1 RNA polymerase II degradation factor 1 isoform X2 [Aedes aegypti]EAT41475.1 AAEL006890-PA [Aedes aegypti]